MCEFVEWCVVIGKCECCIEWWWCGVVCVVLVCGCVVSVGMMVVR